MQEEIKEIRTVRITSKGQISIPSAVRAKAGFEEGAKINIVAYDDRVELRPMKKEKITDAMMAMLASEKVLAKNWLSKEDEEAWKDL
ncbi:MAG: AbrB/MazE/SpoVT family DNA-binding domain-containing protein [Nanoarchaeota archaeon]